MKDQIEAIYKIVSYIDDKFPACGEFRYAGVSEPFITVKHVRPDMRSLLEKQITAYAQEANLRAYCFYKREESTFRLHVSSDLMAWDCIFPNKQKVPNVSPLEWFTTHLQEQLFPRTMKGM